MPPLLIRSLVAILACAVIDFLVQRAPFVSGDYKPAARWVVLLACVLWLASILWPVVPH